MMIRSLYALTALALLTAPRAQSLEFEPELRHDPGNAVQGTVAEVFGANLFDHNIVDFVARDPAGLVFGYGPARYEATVRVDGTFEDLALLRSAGNAPSTPVAVRSGAVWTFAPAGSTMSMTELAGAWVDARAVDAWAGGGGIGFVTVHDADGTFHTSLVSTASGTPIATFSSFTDSESTGDDYLLCNLDGTGEPELVQFGPRGLTVRALGDGSVLQRDPAVMTGTIACMVGRTDTTTQRFACAVHTNGVTTVQLLSGSSVTQALSIVGSAPIGMAAGTVDDDAWSDLALTFADAIRVWRASADGSGFDSPTSLPSCGTPTSAPCLSDFDGDGDADLLTFDCDMIALHPSGSVDGAATKPGLLAAVYRDAHSTPSPGDGDVLNRIVELTLSRPSGAEDVEFSHVQVLVWRAPSTDPQLQDPVDLGDSAHNWIVPFTGWPDGVDTAQIEFQLEQTVGFGTELFYLELRLFEDGPAPAALPSQFFVGTWENSMYAPLADAGWTAEEVPTEVEIIDRTREIGGGVRVIHFRPRPSYPTPEPGPVEEDGEQI